MINLCTYLGGSIFIIKISNFGQKYVYALLQKENKSHILIEMFFDLDNECIKKACIGAQNEAFGIEMTFNDMHCFRCK